MKSLLKVSVGMILLLGIASCSSENSEGLIIKEPTKACVDGYIYFYNYGSSYGRGYMSPKFDEYGKLIHCSMTVAKDDK